MQAHSHFFAGYDPKIVKMPFPVLSRHINLKSWLGHGCSNLQVYHLKTFVILINFVIK